MTISVERNYKEHTGNGTTTVWSFDFPILSASELNVYTRVIATGVITLVPSGDYSYTGVGNSSTGGTVTYPLAGSPLASTHKIYITRQIPYTQLLDLDNQTPLYPNTIERALDRLTALIHQGGVGALVRQYGFGPYQGQSERIENIDDPVGTQDAATKNYVDDTLALYAVSSNPFAYATQLDAEEQTDLVKIMPALRVKQTIDERERTTLIKRVATYAALTALSTADLENGQVVFTDARTTVGDGGHGFWHYDSASAATADGGVILAPDAGSGRWLRHDLGGVDPRWYGFKFDGLEASAGANVTALNALIVSLNAGVFNWVRFPALDEYAYLNAEPSTITAGGVLIEGGGIFGTRLAMVSTAGTAATFFRITGAKCTIRGFTFRAENYPTLDGTRNPIEIEDGSRHTVNDIEVIDTSGALTVGSATGSVQQSTFENFRGSCQMMAGGKIIWIKDCTASHFDDFSVAGQNSGGAADGDFAGFYCAPAAGINIDGNAFHRIVHNMPNDNSVECKNCYIDATDGSFVNFTFLDCIFDQGEGSNIEIVINSPANAVSKVRGQFVGTRATSRAAAGTFPTVVLSNLGDKLMDVAFIGGRYNGSSAPIFDIHRDLGVVTNNSRIRLNGCSLVDRSNGGAAGMAAIECNAPGIVVDGCYVLNSDEDLTASYGYLIDFDQDVDWFMITNNYAPDLTLGVCDVSALGVTGSPEQVIRGNSTPFRDGALRIATTTDATQTSLARWDVPNNQIMHLDVVVNAIVNGATVASYRRTGTFRGSGGVATLVGSVTDGHTAEVTGTWDCTLDANGSQARVRITGQAATTIKWQLVRADMHLSPA